MTPVKAVLFDRDETIAYTDKSVYKEAALWLADRHGLDAHDAGKTLAAVWAELGEQWWDLRSTQDEEKYWQDYGTELTRRLGVANEHAQEILEHYPYERFMKPVSGAREVLTELRARNLKIGVLSNTLPSIEQTLEAVGLADLVDVALSTCTLGVHKPEAEAFLLAAKALKVNPDEVLFIDDREENVEAARRVGMHAELIDLRGTQPGVLHSLHDVLKLVADAH